VLQGSLFFSLYAFCQPPVFSHPDLLFLYRLRALKAGSQDPQASIPCILAGPVPLEVSLPGTRPFGKYVQNQSGPVHNLYSCHLFNIPHLDSESSSSKIIRLASRAWHIRESSSTFPLPIKMPGLLQVFSVLFFQNNRSGSAGQLFQFVQDLSPSLFLPQ